MIDKLKNYWWIIGLVASVSGFIILWGSIPDRVAKAEDRLEKQAEVIDDLKGFAREIAGYTRAVQQQAPVDPEPCWFPGLEAWGKCLDKTECWSSKKQRMIECPPKP